MVFCFIRHFSSFLILQVAFVKCPFLNCCLDGLNRRWVVCCAPVLENPSLFNFSESEETKDIPAIVDGASAGGEVPLEGPTAGNLLEGER